MKQNDIIAGLLAAGIVTGLALWRDSALRAAKSGQGGLGPTPPPGVIIPPGTPGSDVQLSAAQQAVTNAIAILNAQGGGTQAQKEAAASSLESLASQITQTGGSAAAAAYLLSAASALRSGQLPAPAPMPMPGPMPPMPAPTPAPGQTPSPSSDPALASAQQLISQTVAALQSQGGNVNQAQLTAAATALQTQATILASTNQSPAAVALLQNAATQLQNGQIPTMTTTASPPPPVIRTPLTASAPSTGAMRNLHARYQELREHLMAHLQGARSVDHATLGAADRTTADLHKGGDAQRAADLGTLADASYRRAGITRPRAVYA